MGKGLALPDLLPVCIWGISRKGGVVCEFNVNESSISYGASLGALTVKNLPAVQETQVRSLDREDPLEKEVAIHSSILAWRIPRTEEPGGPQSMRSQRVRHD